MACTVPIARFPAIRDWELVTAGTPLSKDGRRRRGGEEGSARNTPILFLEVFDAPTVLFQILLDGTVEAVGCQI